MDHFRPASQWVRMGALVNLKKIYELSSTQQLRAIIPGRCDPCAVYGHCSNAASGKDLGLRNSFVIGLGLVLCGEETVW